MAFCMLQKEIIDNGLLEVVKKTAVRIRTLLTEDMASLLYSETLGKCHPLHSERL